MSRKIIGIAGKARSGKDTVAEYLWRQYGFTRLAFADPLKLAAQQIFGLSEEQTWGAAEKETVIPYWGKSPRQMMQLLGTECVKPYFGEDIWVKRMGLSLDLLAMDDVVIPDVRFQAEADYIHSLGGKVVRIDRDAAQSVSAHISEAGLPTSSLDAVLTNNGSLDQLFVLVDDLIESYY